MGLQGLKGFFSLADNVNKDKGTGEQQEVAEGIVSDKLPELKLSLTDDELIDLSKKWRERWDAGKDELEAKRKTNEEYWLGKQFDEMHYAKTSQEGHHHHQPLTDNLLFEALETFLPIATRQNPEPLTESDDTPEGIELASNVKKMLVHLSDLLRLRLKVKTSTRFWALYYVGAIKISWSVKKNDIVLKTMRPQKLILDPDGTVEEGEYTGEFIGEVRKETAGKLKKRFPDKAEFINKGVGKKGDGTEIQYTEWWTDDYMFWELEGEVLGKAKNPHWNYPEEKLRMATDEFGVESPEIDEEGNAMFDTVGLNNHFPFPRMPYMLLSVFNLGKHPWDDTSLIEQNLSLQDLINKRQRQIDKNVDSMNAGWVISGGRSGLTKAQASRATEAIRKGGVVYIPDGSPQEAVYRYTGTGLPNDVFNNLQDTRNELRGIFGVTGLSPQGTKEDKTVRGKIIVRGQDVDRIGGGIGDYLEQFVDGIFNYMVQMMFVYYTEKKSASVLGDEGAREYISLVNTEFNKDLTISVKEGSLIPKDSLTQRNEAVELWGGQALDPITLYERLEFPNPRESAQKLLTWMTNPTALFDKSQEGMVQPGMPQPAGGGGIEQAQPQVEPSATEAAGIPMPPIQTLT